MPGEGKTKALLAGWSRRDRARPWESPPRGWSPTHPISSARAGRPTLKATGVEYSLLCAVISLRLRYSTKNITDYKPNSLLSEVLVIGHACCWPARCLHSASHSHPRDNDASKSKAKSRESTVASPTASTQGRPEGQKDEWCPKRVVAALCGLGVAEEDSNGKQHVTTRHCTTRYEHPELFFHEHSSLIEGWLSCSPVRPLYGCCATGTGSLIHFLNRAKDCDAAMSCPLHHSHNSVNGLVSLAVCCTAILITLLAPRDVFTRK